MNFPIAQTTIKEFVVTAVSGSGLATIPDLPVDGSLGLAALTVDEQLGEWRYGQKRHLIAFLEGNSNSRIFVDPNDPQAPVSVKLPSGWVFISEASVP